MKFTVPTEPFISMDENEGFGYLKFFLTMSNVIEKHMITINSTLTFIFIPR